MYRLFIKACKAYLRNYAGLPKKAWQGIILSLIESTLMGLFYFLSIYFIQDLHFNIAVAGSIISFYGLGAMAGGILCGKLSDLISPQRISVISLIIQACGYLALIYLKDFHLLALTMLILGIASYGFITANQLTVLKQCEQSEPQTLRAINLLSSASNLGLAISAIIISSLAGLGFHALFFMVGFSLFLISIYLCYQNQKHLPVSDKKHAPAISRQIRSPTSQKSKYSMLLVLSFVLLVGIIVTQLNTSYAIYIQDRFPALGLKGLGILFALNSMMVVFLETPIGNFLSHYNKVLMVGIGGFLIGIGMYLLSFSHLFIFALFACVIYTIGEIIFFCMAQFVCYQHGSKQQKGFHLGLFRTVYAASRVIGPFAGGYIYYHFGGDMLWLLSGFIGTVCLLACFHFYTNSPALATADKPLQVQY